MVEKDYLKEINGDEQEHKKIKKERFACNDRYVMNKGM